MSGVTNQVKLHFICHCHSHISGYLAKLQWLTTTVNYIYTKHVYIAWIFFICFKGLILLCVCWLDLMKCDNFQALDPSTVALYDYFILFFNKGLFESARNFE